MPAIKIVGLQKSVVFVITIPSIYTDPSLATGWLITAPFLNKRVSHCRLFYQKSHYANLWTCITKNESLWLLVSFHTSAVVFWGGAFFSFLFVWVGRGIHVHIVDLVCQCLVFRVLNYNAKIYLLLRALVESLFTFYNAHLSKLLLLPFTLNN